MSKQPILKPLLPLDYTCLQIWTINAFYNTGNRSTRNKISGTTLVGHRSTSTKQAHGPQTLFLFLSRVQSTPLTHIADIVNIHKLISHKGITTLHLQPNHNDQIRRISPSHKLRRKRRPRRPQGFNLTRKFIRTDGQGTKIRIRFPVCGEQIATIRSHRDARLDEYRGRGSVDGGSEDDIQIVATATGDCRIRENVVADEAWSCDAGG